MPKIKCSLTESVNVDLKVNNKTLSEYIVMLTLIGSISKQKLFNFRWYFAT